jgi:hypothetical protein
MTTTEQVEIEVALSSSFWDQAPKAKVYIDEQLIFDNQIVSPTTVKFSGELTEGKHKLVIELYDKNKYQTVLENGQIVKDQLLNIDSIMFDEIDCQYLKHSLSTYFPNNPSDEIPAKVKNCINLGYNGRWEFEFTTPIYIWLLENL